MTASDEKFQIACARFDAAHAEDPTRIAVDGEEIAAELLYARRMSQWLQRLAPAASEPLRLAARCQHIRRWKVPRSSYPEGRAGYHQWRTTLARFHADQAAGILAEVGYEPGITAQVQSLLRKENLRTDPEMQTLEDVICVVFLEDYFLEFSRRHDEQKVIGIVRKTWKKMSPLGQKTALSLSLPPEARALVERALHPD